MGLINKLGELWEHESGVVVHGWIRRAAKVFGPEDEGQHYLSISCSDLGIRYDRERFGERRPGRNRS